MLAFSRVRGRASAAYLTVNFAICSYLLEGCASPGPPRAPSLFLPRLVSDLQATRTGDTVALHFTVPSLSTDGQPLRLPALQGVLCRQDSPGAPCRPVDAAETAQPVTAPGRGGAPPVLWTDTLPAAPRTGAPRPIAYRVELRNAAGRSAGFSDAVYTAAGSTPPPVSDLRAEGTRLGVALRWAPAAASGVPAGEVLLQRVEPGEDGHPGADSAGDVGQVAPAKPRKQGLFGKMEAPFGTKEPLAGKKLGRGGRNAEGDTADGPVWLQAAPGDASASATMDSTIEPGVLYRYTAIRREQVKIGGRSLVLESRPSAPVEFTWRDTYAPGAPAALTGLGYATAGAAGQPAGYAVDLIWQPVEDPQLAGYVVSRQTLTGAGLDQLSAIVRLTPEPVPTPGFHDATALPGQRYRYRVTAVGTNGRESGAVETVVEASPAS